MTPPGRGQFGPQGHDWQNFIKGLTKHCFTQNIKALEIMASEKKIVLRVFFLPIVSLWRRGQLGPQGHDCQDL